MTYMKNIYIKFQTISPIPYKILKLILTYFLLSYCNIMKIKLIKVNLHYKLINNEDINKLFYFV